MILCSMGCVSLLLGCSKTSRSLFLFDQSNADVSILDQTSIIKSYECLQTGLTIETLVMFKMRLTHEAIRHGVTLRNNEFNWVGADVS